MQKPRFDILAEITGQVQISPDIFLLTVDVSKIAEAASPGQFCMVEVKSSHSMDPLLRRPLSIHRIINRKEIVFLYRVVGQGTCLLSQHCPGDRLHILGPLGHGFRITPGHPAILIGGGLGAAPLLFLAEELPKDPAVSVILGARTEKELLAVNQFIRLGHRVLLATEDGSVGRHGLITDVLSEVLSHEPHSKACIFTCGPWSMMKAVYKMTHEIGLSCQVSLEARMACGIGLCLGCAVPRRDGQGYLHVCTEGPVFDADKISWGSSQ
ncbi:MAG: dihydroorotate dehydrogenase electron transfer subunit [Nitrospiraceae bacterium]|nr:dihydroorotate dehydrogenase electron transfer subunit [Nitrospiraceae bacterium]